MAADNDFALDYLADCLYDALLHHEGAARPADLLHSLPAKLRVGVGLIRQVLASDERFVEVDGRWEAAGREELRHRPFGGLVTALVETYGRPMPLATLARAVMRVRGGAPAGARKLLEQYLSRPGELLVVDHRVLCSHWLLRVAGEDEEQLLFYNALTADAQLAELRETCRRRRVGGEDALATAVAILQLCGQPLRLLQLSFLTAVHHREGFDPVQFVRDLMADERIVFLRGPRVFHHNLLAAVRRHLQALAENTRDRDETMPAAALAALLAEPAPDVGTSALSDEECDSILAVVGRARSPVGINELLADVLQLRPNARRYKAAAHAVAALLDSDPSLMRTSPGYYIAAAAIPDWVAAVPEELVPDTFDPHRDVLLRPEGLHETLQEAVVDPRYEDIFSEVPAQVGETAGDTERIDYPLLYHHYLAGTMFLRTIDQGLLGGEGSVSVLAVRTPDERVFSVWLNRELRLLLGLGAWYREAVPPVGAVLSLRPGDSPHELLIACADQTDPAISIPAERRQVLEDRRRRLATRPLTIFDLTVDLLHEQGGATPFDRLWSEANVVRRVTRLQLASALSWFRCFDFVAGRTGRWKLVPELIDAGGREELRDYLWQQPPLASQGPPG